jgi:DNA-directed RNA polymerase subunit M/transcription elongation factor TFIIS
MPYIVWSQRCKKCKGQFYLEEAEDGKYLTCIQCGHSERIVNQEVANFITAIQPNTKKAAVMEEAPESEKELSRV